MSADVCMSCGGRPEFSTSWWDGVRGDLVRGFLCAECARDEIVNGSQVGVDLFPLSVEGVK